MKLPYSMIFWFGGDSVIPSMQSDKFRLIKGDICTETRLATIMSTADCVVHLAAIVGFPAYIRSGVIMRGASMFREYKMCGRQPTRAGVKRFIFASSYSNYGESQQGELVTETSPLQPKSIYAETKIEAEKYLLCRGSSDITAPTCLRLATVFGLSPRTRFDLIINQFVLRRIDQGSPRDISNGLQAVVCSCPGRCSGNHSHDGLAYRNGA